MGAESGQIRADSITSNLLVVYVLRSVLALLLLVCVQQKFASKRPTINQKTSGCGPAMPSAYKADHLV